MAEVPVDSEPTLISPWARTPDDIVKAKSWVDFLTDYDVDASRYETPFCVLSDLLERWTMIGDTVFTAECTAKERFKRLIEVIGGYPLIGGGYRPLDFPAHPLSKPALVLSAYLDSIQVNGTDSDWHSVRSHALMYDLTLRKKIVSSYTDPLENLTSFLLWKIINHEGAFNPRNDRGKLSVHERKFLAILHSHNHNRKGFWPPILKEKMILDKKMHKDIFDFHYHEFKLKRIQTWIKHWSHGLDKQAQGVRQNFLIGPSVILESIFVRVRSYILKEFGMGSICIDGGGRIAFLSTKSRAEVSSALEEFLHFSFLDVGESRKTEFKMLHHKKGNREHRHPYASTISKAMNTYIQASGKEISQETFFDLVGKDVMKRLLPAFSIKPDVPELVQKQCFHRLEFERDTQLNTENCALCEGRELDKLTEKNCTDVCPMHWLIYEIAKISKIRNASLGSQPGPTEGNWTAQYGQISDVVALDGNSLGQIFLTSFDWRFRPFNIHQKDPLAVLDEEDIREVWGQFCEQNTSLRQQRHQDERAAWEEILQRKKIDTSNVVRLIESSDKLRLDAFFRLTRRSFSFNANWALAFQNIIYAEESGLSPWIYAGDDIVLVNRKGNQEDITTRLDEFHQELNRLLQDCDISFAGGWASKSQEKAEIHEMLDRAHENERLAKHTWKGRIRGEATFGEILGGKTHCEICFRTGQKWLEEQEGSTALIYATPKDKPHSLILKVKQEDLSTLAQKNPSNYEK